MLNLDLTKVTEQGSAIPDGTYPVAIVKAEVSPTKSGGTMIKVQYKISDGAQEGRVIFDQFNIENANPKAVQIGLGQLKGMMKAFGHSNPNMLKTTDEFLGLVGTVTVKTVDDDQYGPQTRVKGYKPFCQAQGSQAAPETKKANPFS